MSSKSDWPQFGPEDAEGFRSFSLYDGTQEHIRVSVRFSALQEYFERTAGDLNQYSPLERESFKAAAALAAAKILGRIKTDEMSHADITQLAFTNLLESGAKFALLAFEKWFPGLATIALKVAGDACVKKALNNMAQSLHAPVVTTEKSVGIILGDLNGAIKMFLRKKGRRLETPKLLRDMQMAMKRLKLKSDEKPTQEQVAESMDIDPRTLRKNMTAYGIKSWDEMLLACEYWEELNTP